MSKKKILTTIALVVAIFTALAFSGCTIRGMSAYEIAVRNGFVGTEAQWLTTLKGNDGSDVSVEEILELYLQQNPDATYEDFLTEYMSFNYTPTATAAAKALKSSVSVIATFQRAIGGAQYSSAGSGVIYNIDDDGNAYILTNYHVIYDSSAANNGISGNINLSLYGMESSNYQISASYVGGSIDNDIALLKAVSPLFLNYQPVEIANSNFISAGQPVLVAGNPAALGIAVTSGVISVDSENITMPSLSGGITRINLRVIRIDAAVNSGNSGGGLFDNQGRLIGIVNAKIADESIENIGYAIPANIADGIAYNIIQNDGNLDKKLLGVMTETQSPSVVYNNHTGGVSIQEDVVIQSVSAGSLAANANLKAGDKLIAASLDGGETWLELMRNFYLPDYMYYVKSGDTLTLKFIRGGETQQESIQF